MCWDSVLQAPDRDDKHSIRAAVGEITGSVKTIRKDGAFILSVLIFACIAFRLTAPFLIDLSPIIHSVFLA